MRPIDEAESAATDAPHFGHAVGASGEYLGFIDVTTPGIVAIAATAPPPDGTWVFSGGLWVRTYSLAEIKELRRQEMAQAWYEARLSGVTVGTKTAPTDSAAWVRYLTIRQMASESGWVDVPIPLIGGSFELLTLTKAQTLWAALKTMERDLLARLRDRVQAINEATTEAEVAAVVW